MLSLYAMEDYFYIQWFTPCKYDELLCICMQIINVFLDVIFKGSVVFAILSNFNAEWVRFDRI